MITRMT